MAIVLCPTDHIHIQLCTGGILCVLKRDDNDCVCVSLDFQPTDNHIAREWVS